MTIKELEKEIKGQISVLDKDELEEVLKFVNQMIIKERIMKSFKRLTKDNGND